MALRERKPDIAIALADVPGAALYCYYTTGELKAEGTSITEGIGQGRITANLEGFAPTHAFLIPDEESVADNLRPAARRGAQPRPVSGVNVAGAIRLARELGPGHTIVTMLCDPGSALPVAPVQPRIPALQGPRRCRTGSSRVTTIEPDFLPVE